MTHREAHQDSAPVQAFTPVIAIPPVIFKLTKSSAFATGLIAGLVIIGVVWFPSLLPRWGLSYWDWRVYACLGLVCLPVFIGVIMIAKRQHRRRLARLFDQWLHEQPRSRAEHAATRLYLGLFQRRRARAAAVKAFLADVPSREGRLIVVGENAIMPVNDGTLWEECDVLEGRARGAQRWLVAIFCAPLIMQFLVAFGTGGPNPFRWPVSSYWIVAPALFNAVVVLYAGGWIKSPGTVVLATPNRVQHSTARGLRVYTIEDSVVVLMGYGKARSLLLYRSDGRRSILQYPGDSSPGLQALINRWCMATPPQVSAPAENQATPAI